MKFRPALVPTLFVGLGLVILLNLGAWQLRRHATRSAQMDTIEFRLDDPPVRNAELVEPYGELSWRKANLVGHFLDVPPELLAGRFEFGVPGYDLIQPFQLDDGPAIMVVRGWIPSDGWRQMLQDTATNAETLTLQGMLIEPLGEADSPRIPADDVSPPRFHRDAFEAVRLASSIDTAPVILIVGSQLDAGISKSRESYPVTGYVPKPKSLPHLQYAGTWFLIAGTLIVIWLVAGFRRGQLMDAPAPR